MENIEVNGSVSVSNNVNIGGDVLVQGKTHLKSGLKVDGILEADNVKVFNGFMGYFYGVSSVLREIKQPETGMFFLNGETNSIWAWDTIGKKWIDTNRVDGGLNGMLTDREGNSPEDYSPSQERGVKEAYFYVAECEDVEANPNAKSKTITFTYFKNGASSISVTVKKTSIVTLYWNGDYWETSVVPFINANYSVYADKASLTAERERALEAEQGILDSVNSLKEIIYKGETIVSNDIREECYLDAYAQIKESFTKTTNVAIFNVEGYKILSLSMLSGNMATVVYKFFSDTELTTPIDDSTVNAPILITDDSGVKLNNYLVNIPLGAKAVAVCYNKQEALNVFAGDMRFADNAKLDALQENVDLLEKEIVGYFTISESSLKIIKGKISPTDGSIQPSGAFGYYEINLNGQYKALKAKMLLFDTSGYAFYDKDGNCIKSANANVTNNGDWEEVQIPENAVLFRNSVCIKEASADWQYLYFPIEKVLLDDGSYKDSLVGKLENTGTENADVVFVPKGGYVFADGASFLQNYINDNWLANAMNKLGLRFTNIAVGGQSIKDTAQRLALGIEYSVEQLEDMDLFLIQHVHNQDVFTFSQERNIREYEDIIRIDYNSLTYAEAYDYVIKKHLENCYNMQFRKESKWYGVKGGKPSQMLLCTHWHDGRKTFNSSVRKLCAKWGIALCKMDTNIGFSKNATHPVATFNGESAQMSVFYSQKSNGAGYLGSLDESETEVINGENFGFHPYFGAENYYYLANKMASVLIKCICVDNTIKWSESFNLDNYKTQGIYYISGERLSNNDNLPILNAASGHTISGQLTVLDASLSQEERCVTQYLKLTNRLDKEGKEYIRTYNRYIDGVEKWSVWKEIKQTANLNQISDEELKGYTENGTYEGVIVNSTDVAYVSREYDEFNASIGRNELRTIPTACLFTMEVQNNYAVIEKFSEMVGEVVPHTIVQRVKFVAVNGNAVEVKRVCAEDSWSNWININQ